MCKAHCSPTSHPTSKTLEQETLIGLRSNLPIATTCTSGMYVCKVPHNEMAKRYKMYRHYSEYAGWAGRFLVLSSAVTQKPDMMYSVSLSSISRGRSNPTLPWNQGQDGLQSTHQLRKLPLNSHQNPYQQPDSSNGCQNKWHAANNIFPGRSRHLTETTVGLILPLGIYPTPRVRERNSCL